MFKGGNIKVTHFVLGMSLVNLILFNWPFYTYVFHHTDYKSLNGVMLIASLILMMVVLNALIFYLAFFISRAFGKGLLVFFFVINAISLYFINTYSVIIDESMTSNIFNTNYQEASSFFSFKMVLYVLFLGVLPGIFIVKAKITGDSWKRFLAVFLGSLFIIAVLVFANGVQWLWIDKNTKQLLGLALPTSYTVNTTRHFNNKLKENKKEIILPDATIGDNEKAVVVLVLGESARKQNFSLYGYEKNTNPTLSRMPDVFHFDATSCATYTTAGIKCILEHTNSNDLYEILPNYLYRNEVEVIWRTTNWGEPPVHIANYQRREDLQANCQGEGCDYDEVLLTGLREQILASKKNKILIILHTSTSHGPTYSKKYPPRFEAFSPVCNSVELANCSHDELVNAYDNTLVYTDHILSRIIEDLKQLKEYKSTMLFVSDHGESLGEKNLYMHGVPMSFAPKEQYEIPFIVWVSEGSKELKPNKMLSQNHVFHSVLNFLNIQSPVYNEELNIFK